MVSIFWTGILWFLVQLVTVLIIVEVVLMVDSGSWRLLLGSEEELVLRDGMVE